MTLTAATCFSGIGAPEVAMPGWDWKFHAEIEKFPSAVMTARHPDSVNLGDVLAPDFIERAKELGPIDVMAGGPPCQGFSVAGLRGGMSDPRGNLTLRWVQIQHAIQPRNAVTENVPGWLSMPDNAFGCFLAGLVGADDALHSPLEGGKWPGQGMASGPRARCAWRILDAQYSGVAQRRRRVFVVADFGNGADPAQVLFERQGLQGNTPPSREKGKGATSYTPTSFGKYSEGVGTLKSSGGDLGGGSESIVCAEIAPTLNAHFGDKQGLEDQHINGGGGLFVSEATAFKPSHYTRGKDGAPSDISPPLTADADKGDQDAVVCAHVGCDVYNGAIDGDIAATLNAGSGVNNHSGPKILEHRPIAFSSKDYGNDATDDLSPTLRAMPHDKSHPNGGGQMAVAFAQNQRDEVRTMDVAGALAAEPGMKQQTYVAHEPAAYDLRGREGGAQFEGPHDTANIRAASGGSSRSSVAQEWAVRRLTPVECARLQGFEDDYLDIEFRGKPAADGNKYKALGNSWAVPCGQWILERIERFMP